MYYDDDADDYDVNDVDAVAENDFFVFLKMIMM